MSEFGHFGKIGDGFCIDAWGAGPFIIEAGGKSWRFEDSDRFGPGLVKRNGDTLTNPHPPSRSPFWRAHMLWVRQGRRLQADGMHCIWDEPKPQVAVSIGKRDLYLIEAGEDDGKLIVLDDDDPRAVEAIAALKAECAE